MTHSSIHTVGGSIMCGQAHISSAEAYDMLELFGEVLASHSRAHDLDGCYEATSAITELMTAIIAERRWKAAQGAVRS